MEGLLCRRLIAVVTNVVQPVLTGEVPELYSTIHILMLNLLMIRVNVMPMRWLQEHRVRMLVREVTVQNIKNGQR